MAQWSFAAPKEVKKDSTNKLTIFYLIFPLAVESSIRPATYKPQTGFIRWMYDKSHNRVQRVNHDVQSTVMMKRKICSA